MLSLRDVGIAVVLGCAWSTATAAVLGAPPHNAGDFANAGSAHFECLGRALATDPINVQLTARDKSGNVLAFGVLRDDGASRYDAFVIDVGRGKTEWLDLQKQFARAAAYIQMTRAASGHVYLCTGAPTHFYKYDVSARRLMDLGVPGGRTNVFYSFGHHIGPDGKFYVAGYPSAHAVVCDPRTDTVRDLGCMTTDPAHQKYAWAPAVDGANRWLYTPLGLHHMELCAYNLQTGEKRQILPAPLTSRPGVLEITAAEDGNVYGEAGDRKFLCTPEGVRDVATIPPRAKPLTPQMIAGFEFGAIGADGKLAVTENASSVRKVIDTPLHAVTYGIYCVGCQRGDWVYGGGGDGRPEVFACNSKTGQLRDFGRQGGGGIQVYDLLNHPNGIYLSSYPDGCLDLFVPETQKRVAIARLSEHDQQERLERLTLGPDGRIYAGGIPIKGHVGGAIVRLNPTDHRVKVWRDVVRNQSIIVGVAVPATQEMFFATSIRGGSGVLPVETEAFVFLWSCAGEKIVWQGQPITGAKSYSYATMGRNGLIYCLADDNAYCVFAPVRREVVYRGTLPVAQVRSLGLAHEPTGPGGLIYGLGDDALFALDPTDHTARIIARHESLSDSRGLLAAKDGTLYYGSGPNLWRVVFAPTMNRRESL